MIFSHHSQTSQLFLKEKFVFTFHLSVKRAYQSCYSFGIEKGEAEFCTKKFSIALSKHVTVSKNVYFP